MNVSLKNGSQHITPVDSPQDRKYSEINLLVSCIMCRVLQEQEVKRSPTIQVVLLCIFIHGPELRLKHVASCDGVNFCLQAEPLN